MKRQRPSGYQNRQKKAAREKEKATLSGSIEKYVTPTSSREENKVDRGKNLKTDLEKKGSEDPLIQEV